MKTRLLLIALAILLIHGCKKTPDPNPVPGSEPGGNDEPEAVVTVPAVQIAGLQETYAIEGVTGGLHLNFEMSGINYLELESVDGYAIAGTATEGQSIITFTAASGGTLTPGEDYYITTFLVTSMEAIGSPSTRMVLWHISSACTKLLRLTNSSARLTLTRAHWSL